MNLVKSPTFDNQFKVTILTVEEISSKLQGHMNELSDCEKCGNYVRADELKLTIQQLKKQFSEKKLNQMIQNHKKDKKKLEKLNQEGLSQLEETWNLKIQEFNCQKDKLKQSMESNHCQELQSLKKELQNQISNKFKESSECLNFRKIEEQMKKQKKYSEAHQIQQRISELEIKEKKVFEKQRQAKIQIALKTLKNKQKTEIDSLNKKTQSGLKELIQEKEKELYKLRLKHSNSIKDLISQQEKQILGVKGQIKSRVSLSRLQSFRSPSKISRQISKKLI